MSKPMSKPITAKEARETALKVHAGCEDKCKSILMTRIREQSAAGELYCVVSLDDLVCLYPASICRLKRTDYESILTFLHNLEFTTTLHTEASTTPYLEIRW